MIFHFYRLLIWSLWTILIGFLLSLSYLYSRNITLNKVKVSEFTMLYQALDNKKVDIKRFLNISNVLLSKKKYPRLPVAIVLKDKCVENVLPYYAKRFNLSICEDMQDSKKLNSILKHQNIKDYLSLKTFFYKNKNFIYRKINKNIYLVGLIKNINTENDVISFVKFITTDGINWFYTKSGILKVWEKTKEVWIILTVVSLILYLFFTIWILKNSKRYKDILIKKQIVQKEWETLNNKLHNLRVKIYNNKMNIIENDNQHDFIKNNSIEELEKELKFTQEKLIELENKEKNLKNTLSENMKKLSIYEKNLELVQTRKQLNKIELLWRYGPSWKERRKIEESVSIEETNLPFLTTQAFIVFENIIENLVVKIDYKYKYKTLKEQIDLIFENQMLPIKYKDNFNNVRRSRNKWFHSGKYPEIEILDFLVEMLHDAEEEPII